MTPISNLLSSFFIYKERQNKDFGFELQENENKSSLNDNVGNTEKASNPQNTNQNACSASEKNQQHGTACGAEQVISPELETNLRMIEQAFELPKNQDIILRKFTIARKVKACFAFVDGMIDKKILNISLLPRLMSSEIGAELDSVLANRGNIQDYLIENVISVHSVSKFSKYSDIIKQILNGVTALFIDGCSECILIETRGYEKRAVESPKTETVIKGSQEAFTENLRTNISLVRRILKNEHLVTEIMCVGKTSDSNCAVLYVEGIVNPQLVEEVKKRIGAVSTDFILGEGMLEQFIEDNSMAIAPQVLSTERPDRAAAFLAYGEVVVITDGTPLAMAMPTNFFQMLHSPEDVHLRWQYASFLRFLRWTGALISLLLPGLYCAVILFHPEMLPTELLISIANAKEIVPFPSVVEVLILEISFELIREGSIRVPNVVGQTLGIVGALILGQAAVQAGLVSPVVVIIVSITALGSFTIPNYSISLAFRILRFAFIIAGACFGFYGISIMLFILVCFTCSMKSFGVPFLAPVAPKTNTSGNMILKRPIWTGKERPDYINTLNVKNQGANTTKWINEDPNSKGQ